MFWNCFYWEVAPFIFPSSYLHDSVAQGKLPFPHSFVLWMSSSCHDTILTVVLSFGRSVGAHTCKNVLSPSAHRWGDGGVVFMAPVPLGSLQSACLPRGRRWALQVACLNSSIQQAQFPLLAWASPLPEKEVNMALGKRVLWLEVMQAILSNRSLSDEDIEAAQGAGRFWCQVCN